MKNQSAIEFLTTYSWAFLILGIFVVSILAFVSTPGNTASTYLPTSCFVSPSFPCYQSLVFTNTIATQFIVVLQNNLGVQVFFPKNSITVAPSYYQNASYNGGCYPQNAMPGATVICNATLGSFVVPVGSQLNPRFTLNYHLCAVKCTAQPYNTTGTAVTITAPYRSVLYQVALSTSPTSGNIAISGVKYTNGANVVFITGLNYPVYAVSSSAAPYFVSWTPSGNIQLGSSAAQSTTANAIGPGTLLATFSATSTTTTSTSTSTTSTSTTSTTSTTSSTTTTTVALSLAIDGVAECDGGNTNTCSMSLSTSNPNDLIIVVTGCQSSSNCGMTVAPTGSGLSFTERAAAGSGSNPAVREDYAIATSALSSESITCATTSSSRPRISCVAFGVMGVGNTGAPFDTGSGIPCTATGTGQTASCTITTTYGNDDIIGISADGNGNTPSAGSGFTKVVTEGGDSDGAAFAENDIVSATQAGFSVSVSVTGHSGWAVIGDAVQGN